MDGETGQALKPFPKASRQMAVLVKDDVVLFANQALLITAGYARCSVDAGEVSGDYQYLSVARKTVETLWRDGATVFDVSSGTLWI